MYILKSKKLLYSILVFIILSCIFLAVSCSSGNSEVLEDASTLNETATDGDSEISDKFDEETELPTEPEEYEDIVQYDRLAETNVVYKKIIDTNGEANLKLDIYYPTNKIYNKNPTIVAFHGGSWVAGTRSDIINAFYPLFAKLRANGYTVVTVQYRYVSSMIYFPSNLEDCIDAILFLAENTDKYDVDPNAIGVTGFSAGAHLAMLCTYAMKTFSISGNFIDLNYCISFAGPTKLYDDDVNSYPRAILYMLDALFNGSYEEKTELYKLGSPHYYLNGDIKTPLMILHGDKDEVVPYSQSTLMFERARESNIPSELITLKNGAHMINFNYSMTPATRDEVISSIEQFIYKYTVK